jgi:hypothetical protein
VRFWKSRAEREAEKQAAEEQEFKDRLAAKLADYTPSRRPSDTAAYTVSEIRPADPYDELHGDGIDADPTWLPDPTNEMNVREIDMTDLDSSDLRMIGELRTRYEHHLHMRKLENDPTAREFNRILRGEKSEQSLGAIEQPGRISYNPDTYSGVAPL